MNSVVSVVGARPQFVKLAPLGRALAIHSVEHKVIHTGQHYDASLSTGQFESLGLPSPDILLGVGSQSHAQQTSAMISALEGPLQDLKPDAVLVYGDTNSTLAAAIVTGKLGIFTAHVEAGLRSGNRQMPEEHNRILVDHSCDVLFAPTHNAMTNLEIENLGSRSVLAGDVMVDVLLEVSAQVDSTENRQPYILTTIHRPYNTDDTARLARIVGVLAASPLPVVLPVHPRLRAGLSRLGLNRDLGALRLVEAVTYPAMVALTKRARAVITDSGGLQKEAYVLGVPTTTVRSETEWTETLDGGWNVLCFDPLDKLVDIALRSHPTAERLPHFGEGHAADTIASSILTWLGSAR